MIVENIFFNNFIIPIRDWSLGFNSLLWQYGRGAFTTTLYWNQKIFFLKDHLLRLKKTCKELQIPCLKIDEAKLHQFLKEETKHASSKDRFSLKFVFYSEQGKGSFIVNLKKTTSLKHISLKEGVIAPLTTPQKIMGNYANIIDSLKSDQDVFRVDLATGKVIEYGVANLGLVKNDKHEKRLLYLINNKNILSGILQRQIIKQCRDLFKIIYIDGVTLIELVHDYDEVLYFNSLRGVLSVKSLKFNKKKISLLCKTSVCETVNKKLGYL